MNKLLFSFLLVALVFQFGNAQKKKAWVKAADHAFQVEEDYYKAFKYYDAALKYKRSDDSLRLLYRMAEAARLIGAPIDARQAFQKLLEAPADSLAKSPYRGIPGRLGEVETSLAYTTGGFSPAAYQAAAKYFDAHPDQDDTFVQSGRTVIEFVNEDQTPYANELLELEVATYDTSLPDFNASPWPWAPPEEGSPRRSKRFYPQFYLAGKEGKYYASATGNLSGCMNNYIANTAINQDRTRVYFTACESEAGSLSSQCDIYYQDLDSNGLPVGERKAIPELRSGSGKYIQIQPTVSQDITNGREVLYFVSNRPGGEGGMDIWKSEYDAESGKFSAPVNETAVNTPGDEITPFAKNGVLYFSSNGQADRYGGFDLFSWDDQWEVLTNMGQKINSSADDFGYSLNATGDRAFFTSNRQSIWESNAELETSCAVETGDGCCCLETYTYKLPCDLEIATVAGCECPETDGCQPFTGPEVRLYDITASDAADSEGFAPSFVQGNIYYFNDRLYGGRKYRLTAHLDNDGVPMKTEDKIYDFTNGLGNCGNAPLKDSLAFECEKAFLTVEVYDRNATPITDARVSILDITGKSGASLNVNSDPGESQAPCKPEDNLNLPLPGDERIDAFGRYPVSFDHTYVVTVTSDRGDLLPERDTITVSALDVVCDLTCNKKMEVVLPPKDEYPTPDTLQLFFDNALPRWAGFPNGNRDVSGQSYRESLADYKNQQDTYLAQFPEESELQLDKDQRLELNTFFANELVTSEILLENFVREVEQILCQGISIRVEALGCTSPKFKDPGDSRQINYNSHLANRRVESAQQDLEDFGLVEGSEKWGDLYQFKQVFRPCKDLTAGNAKDIEEINQARGFERSELGNQKNPKLSHYSIDASKFRRVDLYVVIRKDNNNTPQDAQSP